MPLFEVAILERPLPKEVEETGAVERLVLGPKAVVADDAQAAVITAVLEEDDIKVDKARMLVLVRPFG